MEKELSAIVERVRTLQVQANPGPGDITLDAGWLLQFELVRSDYEFTEDELFEALNALGIPEEYQMSWFEDFASYV